MKKLFVLLLLCLVPYFVVAQYWYKIDAMRIEESDGTKSEWKKCNYSAFIDENRNVKIFFQTKLRFIELMMMIICIK